MLNDHPAYLVKRVQHALRLAVDEALQAIPMTTPQYATLSAVANAPGSSSASLARQAFVTPQTMNEIVHTLCDRGLLVRRSHPEHGRVVQLYLTEKGEEDLGRAAALVFSIENAMLAGLSEQEQANLSAYLQACIEALSERME